jgi:hypothetical protein
MSNSFNVSPAQRASGLPDIDSATPNDSRRQIDNPSTPLASRPRVAGCGVCGMGVVSEASGPKSPLVGWFARPWVWPALIDLPAMSS